MEYVAPGERGRWRLHENNLEHCTIKEVTRGHVVVKELKGNASQHSIQLVTCSGQIYASVEGGAVGGGGG